MSTILQDQAIGYIRSLFTPAELAEVRPYAGEFSAAEVPQLSFRCPAVLVSVLGWRPERRGARLSGRHVMRVRMSAFVVAKHASRDARMRQAASIAERLTLMLPTWVPAGTEAMTIAALEEDPAAENLYGRAIDKAALALWLVDWHQCVRPDVPLPMLHDLLAVEITDDTVQGDVPMAPGPTSAPITVTEDVLFRSLPPSP